MACIAFCSLPYDLRTVDPDYQDERRSCIATGLRAALLDHTRVTDGSITEAISTIPAGAGTTIYRGWMLRVSQYAALYAALAARGVTLINDVDAYRFCHHLPDAYATLEGHTPRTVWLPGAGDVDFGQVHEVLRAFGSAPVILKDYVKSQKHYWKEACFIPDASDRAHVEAVTRRFLALQGAELNEGLVFREFVPLELIGVHPRSGMPLGAEVRTFWLDGQLLLAHPYWADVAVDAVPDLPLAWLQNLVARIPSRFFTIDIALLTSGGWTVMELGDGQVAGLPSSDLIDPFYAGIRAGLGPRG